MTTTTNRLHAMMIHGVLLGSLAAWPQTSGVAIRLVDVAGQAGLTLLNICGGQSKDYILEVNGNGAAFFDYDNDGDLDVLLVNWFEGLTATGIHVIRHGHGRAGAAAVR